MWLTYDISDMKHVSMATVFGAVRNVTAFQEFIRAADQSINNQCSMRRLNDAQQTTSHFLFKVHLHVPVMSCSASDQQRHCDP